ncbi:putative regulatory protein [Sulfolobales Mexican fusellovirus 1]|uniref:putative regulatory protein n=1 Tax=Sulfolobales Mexican fusellovirus 1 TaxID=1298531 RepID=UPI0002C0AECE|nr:putative regulatory protein [Sulfolobales Mexican fusellovirus 1]AGG36558.1 putative regulatory protein [Sulfolobales Mexican fusellovirus 1]
MTSPGRKPKLPEERKSKLDVSLEPGLLKTLNELARARNTSRTSIVEEALREYFQRHGIVAQEEAKGV